MRRPSCLILLLQALCGCAALIAVSFAAERIKGRFPMVDQWLNDWGAADLFGATVRVATALRELLRAMWSLPLTGA